MENNMSNMRNAEEAFLDTIDLKPYLDEYEEVYEIMDAIEEEHQEEYKEEPCLFNCMDCHDFMDYIKRRYPNVTFIERTEYIVGGRI